MRRKALLAVLCWLALSDASGEAVKTVESSVLTDNISQESAPRLYRNAPFGVYAAPYASFSFQTPAFASAPKSAASQLVPVNTHSFLKDSYGNKFVATPQSGSYKSSFPQQYVQLQDLPAHLSQPLVSAGPSYHERQSSPSFYFGSEYRLPSLQSAKPTPITQFLSQSQPLVYAESIKSLAPTSALHTKVQGSALAQQQPSNNKAVYANSQFQRLEQRPQVHDAQGDGRGQVVIQSDKGQLQAAPAHQATVIVNGKKTVITLDTKPPVPLLDLTLLEPLTFANPVVPQVQHFLPKISSVTYQKLPEVNFKNKHQKEFVVQKTKSYDSGLVKAKPKTSAPKKKQPTPTQKEVITYHTQTSKKPTITVQGSPNGGPEFSYEINSPNYKETYNEQVVSYNKETESDPVHYSYNEKTEKEPVTYSYTRSSKEPAQLKQVHYESNNDGPKQLIYHFDSNEHNKGLSKEPRLPPPQAESEDSGESHEETDDGPSYHSQHQGHQVHHEESPREAHHLKAEHREEEYHHRPNSEPVHHAPLPHSQSLKVPVQNPEPQYEAITPEYEEDILIVPEHELNAAIKVDPNQHVQQRQPTPHPSPVPQNRPQHLEIQEHPDHRQQEHPDHRQQEHPDHHEQNHPAAPSPRPHTGPAPHIHEKSKRIIIQEETPEEMHSLREQMLAEMIDQEENNEEDFEQAYKDAAVGFPAYDRESVETEKDIYNPETYGAPRYHKEYDVEHVPFQQYQEEGDEYPKSTRLSYKDARDKTSENYFLDYSINKPEVMTDHYKKKEDYYKTFMKHRPEKYFGNENNKNKQKKSEKYTAAPSYEYISPSKPKPKQYFAQYKAAPQRHEYDYSKGSPRDNSAHDSRAYQRYKSKTQFVEPQFQYGFEPITMPRLILDSELAAMASNDSPESEKPGTRKKIYKENWYIKKTSTSGTNPAS